MNTKTKMAIDPTTGEKYVIELPDSEAVKQEILKLDYPTGGITIIEATRRLEEKFKLSDEQKAAQTKRGERYLGFFHYEVVGAEFEKLLKEGKLQQPGGRGKPYILSDDVPPPPLHDGDIEDIYQQIRGKVAEDLLLEIKANSPAFLKTLLLICLLKWDMVVQEKMLKPWDVVVMVGLTVSLTKIDSVSMSFTSKQNDGKTTWGSLKLPVLREHWQEKVLRKEFSLQRPILPKLPKTMMLQVSKLFSLMENDLPS